MGIGADIVAGRRHVIDGNDGTPFGKAGAVLGIAHQALAQAIEALGDLFIVIAGHGEGAAINLDAGNDIGIGQDGAEGGAVGSGLFQGFLGEDDAGDIFGHGLGGAEQHFAIVAAQIERIGQVDLGKALGDGAFGFVGRQDALAGLHQFLGNGIKRLGHGQTSAVGLTDRLDFRCRPGD